MKRTSIVVALAAILSCAPPAESPPPSDDKPAARAPLTEVLGLPVAADLDEADDVVEYELEIASTEQELVPGQMTSMWTYNGTSPGPLLLARVGDTVRIHVTNQLDEPTTVHWHGLRIDYRMDGIVHGSVVAIAPGETFTYEFVPPDAGTFWYHPHMRSNVQVEAGLYGALIVQEDPELAPDVDSDRMFVIDDVRLNSDGSIAEHAGGMDIMHGRLGNALLVNGSAEHEVIPLGKGRVERWRLVNTANARTFYLRFPGLSVREIGADGGLWPQRMTRRIEELVLPVGARAELLVSLAEGSASASLDAMVLVQDAGGNVVEEPFPLVPVVEDTSLATDEPRAGYTADPGYDVIDPGDVEADVIALSAVNDAMGFRFTVNGKAWPNTDDWMVQKDELHVIEIKNEIGPEHPFHLHGQFFQVLSKNGQIPWESGWRDTVLLPGLSTITIATRFENPGMWMYHCHIHEHSENGMMAMVEVME